MYEKFTDRMRAHGLTAVTVTHMRTPRDKYIRITQKLNDGCARIYKVPSVEEPTAEYLMEHEKKALAFFEMS